MSALAVVAILCAACAPGEAQGSSPNSGSAPGGHVTPSSQQTSEDSSLADGAAAPASLAAHTDRIVTIGDSIMSGLGLEDDELPWPVLLGEEAGIPVTNLACDGAGFVVEGDCGEDFAGLVAQAATEDPDLIIIQSSDNDADESEDDIWTATSDTVAELRATAPGARLVGLSTLWNSPWEEPETISWSSHALESAVEAEGGTFVWIGQPLREDTELLQWDDEHPTEAGQQVLLETIRGALTDAGIAL